ncbi:MAG: hypothetical protein WA962_13725 [Ornithinimicrobium sp.]
MSASPAIARAPTPVRRRAVLVGLLAGPVIAGTACSPERGDQRVGPTGSDEPLPVPPPTLAPDMPVLIATLARTRELVRASTAASGPDADATVAASATAFGTQEQVLTQMVQAAGDDADESASTQEPTPDRDVEAITDLVVEYSLDDSISRELLTVSRVNLPTLMSLHGQRIAAARLLGAPVTLPALRGPQGPGAITMLAALRQAVYGLEVLAARSVQDEREGYREALSALRGPTRLIAALAGAAAPAPPLGYGLPGALGTGRQRRSLARDLLQALPEAIMAGSSARATDDDAIAGTITMMALSVAQGERFGVPMAGFPGLTVPESAESADRNG